MPLQRDTYASDSIAAGNFSHVFCLMKSTPWTDQAGPEQVEPIAIWGNPSPAHRIFIEKVGNPRQPSQ